MLLKQLPYPLAKQATFDSIAALLHKNIASTRSSSVLIPVLAAMVAALGSAAASHPGDVLLTACYAQGKRPPSLARIIRDIYNKFGMRGFLRGLQARLLHVFSIVTLQLVIYDAMKQLLGLRSTGSEH